MALVLSPWFGRRCTRRSAPRFGFGSPSLFTDLVVVRVPVQRQSCAPVDIPAAASSSSNARVVQWTETPDAHVFKLRLPGLKKEDLNIQVEDDHVLYISYSDQLKEEGAQEGVVKEGAVAAAATTSQPEERTFKRKFKLPETADVEQIKAEVSNETLTVIVPKQKTKSLEARKIEVGDGAATPLTSTA